MLKIAAPAVALLASASAASDELNYDYLEVGLQFINLETPERTLHGNKLRMNYSTEILETAYLSLGLGSSKFDNVVFYDIVQNDVSVNVGATHSFSWRLDAYVALGYRSVFSDLADGDETDHGVSGQLAIRWLPVESVEEFELEFVTGYDSVHNSLSRQKRSAYSIAQARWHLFDWLSVSLGAEQSSTDRRWRADLRLSF